MADPPRPGDVISERYRVDRVLGEGGMGVVVAATHLQLDEPYAIKFLHGDAVRDRAAVARFLREARAAVRIKSEHVARVSDFGETKDGIPYLVMELLDGHDLADAIATRAPLPIADAVEYVLQACEGIAEAHALGIVHRDLKPANLFLSRRSDGVAFVKVLDFGISKAAEDPKAISPSLTDTSAVFGSPAYMSPEQIRSAKNVDVRTDIWALGVILHEMLTGRIPFYGESATAVLAAIAADPPPPLRAARPDVPPALEAVVLRCLAKPVEERFATIGELAAALEPFRGEQSIASLGRIRRIESSSSRTIPAPSSPPAAPSGRPLGPLASTDAPVTRPLPRAASRATRIGVAVAFAAVAASGAAIGRWYSTTTANAPRAEAPPPPAASAQPAAAESAATLPATEDPAAASAMPPATFATSATSATGAAPAAASVAARPRPVAPARSAAPRPSPSSGPRLDPTADRN